MISNFEFVSLEAESVLNPAITHPMCVYGGGCGGGNGRDAVVCPAGDSSKVGEVTCFLLVSVKRLIIIIFISVVLDTGCSWGRLVRCLFPLPPLVVFWKQLIFAPSLPSYTTSAFGQRIKPITQRITDLPLTELQSVVYELLASTFIF